MVARYAFEPHADFAEIFCCFVDGMHHMLVKSFHPQQVPKGRSTKSMYFLRPQGTDTRADLGPRSVRYRYLLGPRGKQRHPIQRHVLCILASTRESL